MPSPLSFECSGKGCTTVLPATSGSYTYELRVYNATELIAPSPEKVASRFLTQATLGPKRHEIRDLGSGSIAETEIAIQEWIGTQMNDVEPTLHRTYLRHRFNPAVSTGGFATSAMRSPCKDGSSWVDIAFSRVDQGRFVDVSLTADNSSFVLSVDGVVRTVVASVTDTRNDAHRNCYQKGFRTPLDNLPGYDSTEEIDVDSCHARCVRTMDCAWFNFLPSDDGSGECHLGGAAGSTGGPFAIGGKWRTGRTECTPYEYPISSADDPTLLNMGASCWGNCGAASTQAILQLLVMSRSFLRDCLCLQHGACPTRCGANGFCCKYGRDIGGCVTTDPTKTTHRCTCSGHICRQ